MQSLHAIICIIFKKYLVNIKNAIHYKLFFQKNTWHYFCLNSSKKKGGIKMTEILPIIVICLYLMYVTTALTLKSTTTTELKGKYNPVTQRVLAMVLGTPIYIIIIVQVVRLFSKNSPGPVLY